MYNTYEHSGAHPSLPEGWALFCETAGRFVRPQPEVKKEEDLITKAQAAPEAGLDLSALSPAEQQAVLSFAKQIDLENAQQVLEYGASAQKNIADFSDTALAKVKTGDLGEIGTMLSGLLVELKTLEEPEKKGIAGLFRKAKINSEAYGRRDSAGLQGAAAHCLGYVLLTSMLAAAGLFFAAPWIARYALRLPEAEGSLRLLAGLVPVGCVNLVLGGYLTAAGQVLRLTAVDACERVCCLGLSLLLLRSAPEGLGGACFALLGGDLLASCGAAAVLYGFYRQGWRGVSPSEAPPGLGRRVRKLAAPLALSDYLRAALRTLEQLLIPWGLAQAGASQQRAMAAYGTVTGMVFPVLMLPAAFLYALIDLLIPELAACRAQRRAARLQSVTRQCLRAGLLFGSFTAGLLFVLAGPLAQLLYRSAEAGRLLRLFAPVALVLYLDALVDGMLKGLSEQVANVRYNTITSALDVALLFVLLPRYGLGGYVFTFIAAHLVNFALSLRRLLRVTGLRASAGAAVRTALLAAGAGAAALLTPAPGPEAAELLLRGAVYAGVYGLAACVSGTAELCVPESLRPARRAEKARTLR